MSGLFGELAFLRPHWLWALAALPVLAWWWRAQRQARSAWRDNVDPHLLPHLLETQTGARGVGGLAAALLAFLLAVLALAGPSWRHGTQPLWQPATPLVIAVDLSSAALANDLPPSRLLQARAKIDALLRERGGGQVGLVAFAEDAFTVAPLTADAANVALFTDALSPDIMPVDGSRPGRAIDWSARLLRRAGFDGGRILLLTGDADAEAQRAAAAAARDGYQVSVLGLGDPRGGTYRDADGRLLRARLDADALRSLARAGEGGYAAITGDSGDLRALGVLETTAATGTARGGSVGVRLDDGYWLLLPLMLLAAFAFRRGGILTMLLLCLWLPVPPATAQPPAPAPSSTSPPPQEGSGLWRRADQADHLRMRSGIEAFRNGDFATAERVWHGLPGAEAAYNRGNALAKAGRYEEAIAAYDRALETRPGMEDAIANRRAVEAAMQRQPPPGPRADADGDPRSGQPPQAPQDGQSRQEPSAEDGDEDSGHGDPDDASEQAPEPADARSQEEADTAQRERMRRAQQPQRTGEEARNAAAEPAESAEARELREANEAWLRRVPDDPGGLLRAKFKLEYERRRREGTDR